MGLKWGSLIGHVTTQQFCSVAAVANTRKHNVHDNNSTNLCSEPIGTEFFDMM